MSSEGYWLCRRYPRGGKLNWDLVGLVILAVPPKPGRGEIKMGLGITINFGSATNIQKPKNENCYGRSRVLAVPSITVCGI